MKEHFTAHGRKERIIDRMLETLKLCGFAVPFAVKFLIDEEITSGTLDNSASPCRRPRSS